MYCAVHSTDSANDQHAFLFRSFIIKTDRRRYGADLTCLKDFNSKFAATFVWCTKNTKPLKPVFHLANLFARTSKKRM